jgi:hypothetical protein
VDVCQSWTLHNDKPIYIDAVSMENGAGWHHSNWVFAPDTLFPGDDGVWDCPSRNFDGRAAAIEGGVLYAQSTQSTAETQRFVPGAAILIPAHSRIIGETHALNATDEDLLTHLSLTLEPVAAADVTTVLHGLALEYHPLEIAPRSRSTFTMECDLSQANQNILGAPLDMRLHYVMPHYHKLGIGMRIEAFGGDQDGALIFETAARTGEPGGGTLDPPFELTRAKGLRVSCTFDNPRDETVRWGVGDQEMCVFLAFTDSELLWGGGAEDEMGNVFDGAMPDGMRMNHSACSVLAIQAQ